MVKVYSWGRVLNEEHDVHNIFDRERISLGEAGLPFGMGRSYGDACLNPNGVLWRTTGLNKFMKFDLESGLLTCEAGVLLSDIQTCFMPRGWSLPVTPGTQFVTVGGAIANDVHGKNQHQYGSFGDHIKEIKLHRTDGSLIICSPDKNVDFFNATIGGIGLTGLISEVTLELKPTKTPWIENQTTPFYSLDEFFKLDEKTVTNDEYTVAWLDCSKDKFGRGIYFSGNTSQTCMKPEPISKKRSIPFALPISCINNLSISLFNKAYFYKNERNEGLETVHYKSFFYPLDNINDWNFLYGKKGFYQYQCLIPRDNAENALMELLHKQQEHNQYSCMSVLKTFHEKKSRGILSFAKPGITLAMDFHNNGARVLKMFDAFDEIVREAGGSIYLAKDGRMSKEMFEVGYPDHHKLKEFHDPGISSAMSRRLLGY